MTKVFQLSNYFDQTVGRDQDPVLELNALSEKKVLKVADAEIT